MVHALVFFTASRTTPAAGNRAFRILPSQTASRKDYPDALLSTSAHRPSRLALRLAALALAALTPSAARSQSIPVQNFSFESPTVPANPGFTIDVITGWSGSDYFGVQSLAAYPSLYPTGIPDGAQYAYVNSGFIYQDSATSLVAGTTYTLTAYVGRRPDDPGAAGSISLESFTGGLPVAVLATSGSVTSPLSTFTKFTTTFTANSAQAGQDLGIVLTNTVVPGQSYVQVDFDAVSLTQTPPAVPEASTTVSLGLLLALGLGGMVVAGRRRKA